MANFTKAPIDSKGLFTNVKGELSQGGLNVRVPFLLRRFGTYFRSSDGAPTLSKNDGAILRANAADELTTTVTWVGHATVLVQMHGGNISYRSNMVKLAQSYAVHWAAPICRTRH